MESGEKESRQRVRTIKQSSDHSQNLSVSVIKKHSLPPTTSPNHTHIYHIPPPNKPGRTVASTFTTQLTVTDLLLVPSHMPLPESRARKLTLNSLNSEVKLHWEAGPVSLGEEIGEIALIFCAQLVLKWRGDGKKNTLLSKQ